MPTSSRPAAPLNVTIHQLRIVWAVAHADTVSRAAKQLGLSQPSLSQQIARLETAIGQKVFDRRAGRMELTDVGRYLVDRAERVMREMQELEDGLDGFADGARTIGIAGISSPMRVLLPPALSLLHATHPNIRFDLHEASPGDVLAMLYARRATIGIIAANSVAPASMGFVQVPLLDDPYVLVVPEALDLADVASEDALNSERRAVLNSAIHFVYGTQHQKRIEDWYHANLPAHRVLAHCRSFESAVAMVRSGMGICLAPALSCLAASSLLPGIRLYDVALDIPRPLVALVPSQYRHLPPYSELIDALVASAAQNVPPPFTAAPAFLRRSA